jgi:hypothetical protein
MEIPFVARVGGRSLPLRFYLLSESLWNDDSRGSNLHGALERRFPLKLRGAIITFG